MHHLLKLLLLFSVLNSIGCSPLSQKAEGNELASIKINPDSLKQVISDSLDKILFDSLAKASYKEILQKCGYEKLNHRNKDTTIRLFIFSGAVGLVAEIFTLKKKDLELIYTYDVCILKDKNDSRKFEKTFTHINELTGESYEVGFIKILSKIVQENDALQKKIKTLNLCSLQNIKPKNRDVIILHSETYYLEIASYKEYCIISRNDEQEIENEFRKFIVELQRIARNSYRGK